MLHAPFLPGVENPFPELDGEIPRGHIEAVLKALSAGYLTDVATMTGGGSTRLQSIEPMLLATTQEEEDFRLFNMIAKGPSSATIHEFVTKDSVGGVHQHGTAGELDDASEDSGDYARHVVKMKYATTLRRIPVALDIQTAIASMEAGETQGGTLHLLSVTENLLFFGDEDCIATEFTGLERIVRDVGGKNVVDLRGRSISGMAREVIDAAAHVADFGQFGRLTHMFCSNKMKSDLSQKIDTNARWTPDGSRSVIGTPVSGIATDWDPIRIVPDVFIPQGEAPFVARGGAFATNVGKNACTAPASIVGSAGADSSSKFAADQGGLYYYAVEGVNRLGRSTLVKSGQVTVTPGDRVTLTITAAGGATETAYVIYRGRRNGTNANDDFRQMVRVPKHVSGTTVYQDANQNIPGTSIIFLLNMKPGRKALQYLRYLPLSKFKLYPTAAIVKVWAMIMFGGLMVPKPKQHVILINALPSSPDWNPF